MSQLVDELLFSWDETDKTRFVLSIQNVDVNFDIETARELARALSDMADRAERRRNELVKTTIQFLESEGQ
jgi:hypothetical protein